MSDIPTKESLHDRGKRGHSSSYHFLACISLFLLLRAAMVPLKPAFVTVPLVCWCVLGLCPGVGFEPCEVVAMSSSTTLENLQLPLRKLMSFQQTPSLPKTNTAITLDGTTTKQVVRSLVRRNTVAGTRAQVAQSIVHCVHHHQREEQRELGTATMVAVGRTTMCWPVD